MLGARSVYSCECYEGNFIGANYEIEQDLSEELSDNWRQFNHKFIPIYLANHSDKTKVAAGLACGALWTISKGLALGDIVICPNGDGGYHVGYIDSNYYYEPNLILPHRRKVKWLPTIITRQSMSESLRNSTGSIGTVSDVTKHSQEIESLINYNGPIDLENEIIENPTQFALEEHLEEFLIRKWTTTDLGKQYDIYEDEKELVGRQYPTDTGKIDILAISKDKKTLLVVELKKGRASDSVVGQIQRYMGYVQEELAEPHQEVRGIIIGYEDDLRIKRALVVAKNIEFYRYQITFKLFRE